MASVSAVTGERGTNGLDFGTATDHFEGTVLVLVVENLVTEERVVALPRGAAVVDHALDGVIVAVEIGVGGVPVELHFLVHEADGFSGDAVGGGFPDLEAKSADGRESGAILSSMESGAGVSDGSARELHALDIIEGLFVTAGHVREVEPGVFAGLERLEVPSHDRDVTAAAAVLAVGVVPAAAFVLAVDEKLSGGHDGFFELRDVFFKTFHAKSVGFGESIDGNGVLVAPMGVLEVGADLTLVFHREIDEVNSGRQDGFAKFLGASGFAVTEEGEEGESSHADGLVMGPRAVLVLGFLEPAEGAHDGVFAFLVPAIVEEPGHAVGEGAPFAADCGDVWLEVSPAITITTEALSETSAFGRSGEAVHVKGGDWSVGDRDKGG